MVAACMFFFLLEFRIITKLLFLWACRAARKNQLDTVKLILRNNKDLLSVCDKNGRGVVYYASPHSRLLEHLLSKFPEVSRSL